MLMPGRLHAGDTIGVISPAGPPNMEQLHRGRAWLEQLGFQVRYGKNVAKKYGYLAGSDEERLFDLHEMFANDAVRAILCSRGGYGTARLARMIDFALISGHPKIFWGYSDITYLHTAIRQRTGLITFHGPMLASDLGLPDVPPLSRHLFSQLYQPTILHYDEHISPLQTIHSGVSAATLVGGNLSLLVSSLGTPFEIDTNHKLLLIEDIGEAPFRVDRMLNQLQLAGKLEAAAGFVIGDFHIHSADAPIDRCIYDDVFQNYLRPLDKPALAGFRIGHCAPHFAVPLGVEALLDADRKQLWIQPGIL